MLTSARATTLGLFLVALVACSSSAAPSSATTAATTLAASSSAMRPVSATASVAPSLAPTPSAASTPVPTFKPTPILLPFNSILDSTPKSISTATVWSDLKVAQESNPALRADTHFNTLTRLQDVWAVRYRRDVLDPNGVVTDPRLINEGACEVMIYILFGVYPGYGGDVRVYRAADDIFRFVETTFPSPHKDDLITYLKQFGS